MKPVFEKLQMLEIPPADDSNETGTAGLASQEVIDRVIRRAEELRRNWAKGNGATARSSYRASIATSTTA
jgi:hypothetical protein